MVEFFFYDTQLFRREDPRSPYERYMGDRWQKATGKFFLSEEEFLHLRAVTETEAKWLIAWGGWRGNWQSLRDYVAEIEKAGLHPGMVEPPNGFSMHRRA